MNDLVSNISVASKVDMAINDRYWLVIIKAIEAEAAKCGFYFVKVDDAQLQILPRMLINRLSYAFLFASDKHKAIFKKNTDLHASCEHWFNEGWGHLYLQEVLNALYKLGFVLHKEESSSLGNDESPIKAVQMLDINLAEIDDSDFYNKFYFNNPVTKNSQHDLA